VPCLLRGAHHLANKGLWSLGAAIAVADAAWPNAQVVVAHGYRRKPRQQSARWRFED
jgi:hypothetical protein